MCVDKDHPLLKNITIFWAEEAESDGLLNRAVFDRRTLTPEETRKFIKK